MRVLILGVALCSALLPAQAQGDAAALEKARVLFPEFSNSVYTDEATARKAYDALVELSPAVQQRLLAWLDEQFAAKSADYAKARSGGGIGLRAPSPSDARKIKELQQQLGSIRTIKDEGEMKKQLEESGWPALRELLRLSQSGLGPADQGADAEPDSEEALAALRQARQVGQFRQELRKKLGQPVSDLDSELKDVGRREGGAPRGTEIRASRRAASVLAENEKLKDRIAAGEYAGILEMNHWRIAVGMEPMLIDPKLCDAARDHCKDMATLGFFAHESPVKGKKMPWDRAMRFKTSARGENIAINDSTEAANQAWFLSPGHHKNMFNPEFRVIGLGIEDRHYTQMFR